MTFQEKLRFIRKYKNLTQSELADAIGVSRGNVANLELGNAKPTPVIINCLSLMYGLEKEWLTNDECDLSQLMTEKKTLDKVIAEKYDELDDKYKKFVYNQILQLLELQSTQSPKP